MSFCVVKYVVIMILCYTGVQGLTLLMTLEAKSSCHWSLPLCLRKAHLADGKYCHHILCILLLVPFLSPLNIIKILCCTILLKHCVVANCKRCRRLQRKHENSSVFHLRNCQICGWATRFVERCIHNEMVHF